MFETYLRDEVFIAGGQPSVTYVERGDEDVARKLARAISIPNQIVSLAGPTKTGKTVLCRRILGQREFIWIDGGQISSASELWNRIASELRIPSETISTVGGQQSGTVTGQIPLVATASGSLLRSDAKAEKRVAHTMAESLNFMINDKIILVIDDFHYLDDQSRIDVMRNVKGAVFNGLKVVLLSVTHRAFDAIKAETELTGRFVSINLPNWHLDDLRQIANLGFAALNVKCSELLINKLSDESQENPFLMQKFCWEICFANNIDKTAHFSHHSISDDYDLQSIFMSLAEDSGLPIYQQLAAGPQSRKVRAKRPLKNGRNADIYEATLLALAETGPKAIVTYDELRAALNDILSDMVPQKHEITSALKHLAVISRKIGAESAIDWDEQKRAVNIADPYLRFYLRWKIREKHVLPV